MRRALGPERGIRQITLADIGEAAGMHKSAMLRYFETRDEVFPRLTADGWREWPAALRAGLGELAAPTPSAVAGASASALAARGLFCDLLAQAPPNLSATSRWTRYAPSSSSPWPRSTRS